MGTMTSKRQSGRKRLSDEEIDKIVEDQADDNSMWEKPIRVRGKGLVSLEKYDFSEGVRGKYVGRFAQRANVVVLDPDVAEVFADSESVNQALRALSGVIQSRSEKLQH